VNIGVDQPQCRDLIRERRPVFDRQRHDLSFFASFFSSVALNLRGDRLWEAAQPHLYISFKPPINTPTA
jgi:hypothetical protein